MEDELFLIELYKKFSYSLHIVLGISIIIFLILSWYFIVYFIIAFKKPKKLPKGNKLFKYAVLIPARNESKVINGLLSSLKNQTYNKDYFDVYVIVESSNDPTLNIVSKYGKHFKTIVRKDIENKRTKGYALDEAYKYIKENNLTYDAFLVFDADNLINPDYIELMNDVKNLGYKVGVGYRNFTNASVNWVSSCSAVLFSFINNIISSGRSKLFNKCSLTGTGYYVDFDIIDNEKGWIFNGMTEDAELTTYCYSHNISMYYYRLAMFYDEQSSSLSVVHKQHIRWVWGFFSSRKKFKKNTYDYGSLYGVKKFLSLWDYTLGVFPFIVLIIIEFFALLIGLGLFISSIITANIPSYATYFAENNIVPLCFWNFFISFLYLYGTFLLLALVVFIIDNKNLKFKASKIFVATTTFLFFFSDFVVAFLDGLFHKKKRTLWQRIEHNGDVTSKEAEKIKYEKNKEKR